MIAAGLGGRGALGHRGRSAIRAQSDLQAAQDRLLALGDVGCRSRTSSIQGRRLHFLEAGAGEPLLLLHGAGGGAANWYRLMAPLARNWLVIAPDLPGFGFSDPIQPAAPLGHRVARLLSDWLRSMGVSQAHLVGTSFGGLIALRLPQYFSAQKIVAIDTVGVARSMSWLLRAATLPLIAPLVVSPTRAGTRAMLRHALTATPLPPDHEQALVDYLYASAKHGDARSMARAFVQFANVKGQREVISEAELRNLSSRLLLVWGDRDAFLPLRDVQRAAALAGCPELRIIPRAGHSPNWENPQALLRVIQDFLSQND